MHLPFSDNAVHVEGVDVDPDYLQTIISLINHVAYKSFPKMAGLDLVHLKGKLALSRQCGHLCGCSHSAGSSEVVILF